MGEEVDMGVACGGKDAYPAVFAKKAMSDREAVFAVGDVVEGICGRGVDHLGDAGAQGIGSWSHRGLRWLRCY